MGIVNVVRHDPKLLKVASSTTSIASDSMLPALLQAAKPQAADGGGGTSVALADRNAQPRIYVKIGASSGDLGSPRAAAAAAAAVDAAAPRRPAAGRVTTKSGRIAGRAYTRADADDSDSGGDAEAAAGGKPPDHCIQACNTCKEAMAARAIAVDRRTLITSASLPS